MKVLLFFIVLSMIVIRAYSQSVLPLRADTVVIEKVGGNANLKLKDATRDSMGVYYNIGGGVFRNKRVRMINDTSFIVGNDTIRIKSGSGGSSIDTTNKWINAIRRRPGTDSVEAFKNGTWQFVFTDSIKNRTVSKGAIFGNSTIADLAPGEVDPNSYNGIHRYVMSPADSAAGTTIVNKAIPGHTIHQQDSIWQADPDKATYDWIIVEVGLNSLDPTVSFTTSINEYQKFIDTINAQKKIGAKVIVSTMTPCKQRLIDLYGNTNGLIAYQKWLDMNNAIAGGLPGRITGVDYRVTNHTLVLNDGNDNLKFVYDIGDHVHETNEARQVIAHFWRYALNELGFLQVTQPTNLEQSPFYIVADTIRPFNTNASLFIGNTVNALTTTPIRINYGGTYGPVGDPRNIKAMLYDPGFPFDSTYWNGIGVSSDGLEYHTAVSTKHNFYSGATAPRPFVTIEKLGSTEGKIKFPGAGGFSSTSAPSNIDFGGTLANSFGDPSKLKIYTFNNSGLLSGIGQSYDGSSSQFELHSYANSSFAFYIDAVAKFRITDTSLVAPQLQTTIDTTTFKPLVINSSGYIKRFTGWPSSGSSYTFTNGLNESSGTAKLGGTLIEFTDIDNSGNEFFLHGTAGNTMRTVNGTFQSNTGSSTISAFLQTSNSSNNLFSEVNAIEGAIDFNAGTNGTYYNKVHMDSTGFKYTGRANTTPINFSIDPDGVMSNDAYAAGTTITGIPAYTAAFTSTGQIIAAPLSARTDTVFYTNANNSGTSATDLYTKTIKPNTLNNNGESLDFLVSGNFNDATATVKLEFDFDGQIAGNTGTLNLSATGSWEAKLTLIRTSSSTARVTAKFDTPTGDVVNPTQQIDLSGLNFANPLDLVIYATAGGGGGGSNDITAKLGRVVWYPAQ